ncbi:MAG: 50S ribosomal protein L6 [Candidatus Kerfeldbacteria bacterium]|nr:50S ribosomal protein L6 [Candidatus Kerfeldbacteria bacterium]
MSRIGKLPIRIPAGVTVDVADGRCVVKGPKGELTLLLHQRVQVDVQDGSIAVSVANPDEKRDRALWGVFRVLVANCIEGVEKGFQKQLEIRGVGYRAAVEGQALVLNLGLSHPVTFALPQDISATVEKNVITVSGIDKQLVGETAAKIRKLRPPEPYKGKGIRYVGEHVRQKAGKVVKSVGTK